MNGPFKAVTLCSIHGISQNKAAHPFRWAAIIFQQNIITIPYQLRLLN